MAPFRTFRSRACVTAPARASLRCSTWTTATSWPSISNVVPVRKSFVETTQVLHREDIAAAAHAGDHRRGRRCGHARLAVALLAREEVREVYLDDRDRQRAQAVVEGDRVVRQAGRAASRRGTRRRWPARAF